MENFLREAKNNAVNISTFGIGKVHAVLGSEACDLDSAVSTLVYAFLLHRINQKSDVIVIPVLNVSRKDFRLKTEVVYYLEENNINFTDLVFKNEIDLKALLNNGKLMLTLVDHNSLQKGDSCLHPAVEEIIDHHKKSIDNYSIRCSTTIEMVGSCATLVAEKLFGQDVELCDSQIANLLYGVMVLDTVCFDDSAGRVTEKDKMIARKLEQLLPNVNSRQIFDSLMEAKFDISDLSPEDVLRKDLKLVTNSAINIAVTSLPVLVDHFVTQVASVNDLGKLNAEYNFHILVLMGIHVQLESGEVNRQIGVYSINDTCKQQVADFLMNVPELQLELVDMNISCLTVFRQGNSAASRKVVLPLLSNFLLGDESSTDLLHSSMKMRYSEGSSSAREHRASANEEFNDFDPFESADQSVFTPPNGINVGSAAYFLGVGDPLSLPISSQNSSNQNSCPYTPQNSYADSDFDMDNYTKQLLPSFNSRDMMEKIEIKRGKLRGYEVEPTNENYPFTPKNSFVESTFDGYAAQLPAIDSNTLLQKLHDEKAHLEQSVGDQEEETEGRKKLNDSVSNGRGGQSVNGADERAGAEESSHSPDENSIASSHGDKTDEKMDISTSGSDKDPNSAPISDVDLKVTDKTDNIGNTTALGDFDGAVNAYQEEDLELAVNYQAETVDFPDSPHHMKLLANRTKEKLKNTSLDDDSTQDDEVFRTVLSSGSDDATKKGRVISVWDSDTAKSTYDDSSLDDEYFEDSLVMDIFMRRDGENGEILSPAGRSLDSRGLSSGLADCPRDDSRVSSEIDLNTLQKIRSCFDQEKFKDLYTLCGRLQDILSPTEIEDILNNSDVYAEFIDDDIFEALQNAKGDIPAIKPQLEQMTKLSDTSVEPTMKEDAHRLRVMVNKCDLDDSFLEELKVEAVFEDTAKKKLDVDLSNQRSAPASLRDKETSGNSIRAYFKEANSSMSEFTTNRRKIRPQLLVRSQEDISFSAVPHETQIIGDFDHQPVSPLCVSSPEIGGGLQVPNEDGAGDKSKLKFSETNGKVSWPETDTLHNRKELAERPTSFSKEKKKKIQVSPDILNDDDTRSLSSLSNRSVDILSPGVDDLATPDDIETPDELEDSVLECVVSNSEAIPELSAAEEYDEERSWRTCIIAGVQRKIDMKVIEPYKKVLSHGGYFPETHHAIILFSACNLPDRSRRDYDYVMDNLFLYVLTTLDQLVAEDYILIYLQGATERSGMPSFGWMKRCYQMIDRRLRKNLKGLYLVHPTFWLKTIVLMTKPFISSKFSRKLRFVANLQELSELIPMDHVCIPDKVKQYDEERQTVVT